MSATSDGKEGDELGLRFPTLACAAALAFTVLMLFLLAGNAFWIVQRESKYVANNLEMQALRGTLLYYDEALTMSVLMATVDKQPKWEQRYFQLDDKLQTAINRSIELAPTPVALQTMADLDLSNKRLVRLEQQCFQSIRAGDAESARQILERVWKIYFNVIVLLELRA
ncbi:MAG: hypothetical protein H0X66_21600 [Verrucomicrobia bacterium]|nr:hypothetical protein [Verrucomicrobiota bacterium]